MPKLLRFSSATVCVAFLVAISACERGREEAPAAHVEGPATIDRCGPPPAAAAMCTDGSISRLAWKIDGNGECRGYACGRSPGSDDACGGAPDGDCVTCADGTESCPEWGVDENDVCSVYVCGFRTAVDDECGRPRTEACVTCADGTKSCPTWGVDEGTGYCFVYVCGTRLHVLDTPDRQTIHSE
jgi:hypothetical protein